MLLEEFVNISGFAPSDQEYMKLQAEYEKSDMNKQDWIAEWKKNGGVLEASKAMRTELYDQSEKIKLLEYQLKQRKEEIKQAKEQRESDLNTLGEIAKARMELAEENAKLKEEMKEMKEAFLTWQNSCTNFMRVMNTSKE